MEQLRLIFLACVVYVLVGTGAVVADVTVSKANDPTAALDSELSALLGREQVALTAVDPAKLDRLQNGPQTRAGKTDIQNISYTRDFIAEMPKVSGDEQWRCLTEALYFEARGESIKGQFAVAEVILNRVASPRFPDTVCGVVYQGTGRKFQCQFTYSCDGHKETVRNPQAWENVGKVARVMLDGAPRLLTDGATHYHTKAVNPRWARVFPRTTTIGVHHFYRMPERRASNS